MAVIETAVADNLIASNAHPITIQTGVVASGEGKLARGTVLMRKSNGKYVAAGESGSPAVKYGTCEVILAKDIDATSADTVAELYNSGEFNARELAVSAGYTLDTDDVAALKNAGIYLANSVEVDPA